MSRLDSVSGKVMDLVGQVGDNLRDVLPDNAGKWLQTGAALGVAKTGSRAVGTFVRRNPAVAVAAAVGAGVLWYAVHRHRKKQEAAQGALIEGRSRRVEPRRGTTSRRTRAAASTEE